MKTTAQWLAHTQWDAACVTLRIALAPPLDLPGNPPTDIEGALDSAETALRVLCAAYAQPPHSEQLGSGLV
jgi:hypothetical protein